jgi:acyl-CoA dehydrogenase
MNTVTVTAANDCSMNRTPALESADAERLIEAACEVALIAAEHADAVDREGRFPVEAVSALKAHKLLGAMVPQSFGGAGMSLAGVAAVCQTLGQACSSTAMVFAMHQIQVACILEHAPSDEWHHKLLGRLTGEQLLLASATSEVSVGGNLRNSACAVQRDGSRFSLEKLAPTISYGAYADGILVTARRTAESPANDQVLITVLASDYELERRGGWDALGMRGTCSESFRLQASGQEEQILQTPFGEIADMTMLPVSHTLWCAVWIGIAADTANRAKAFFRAAARARPGALPPSGARLSEAVGLLQMMQARLSAALAHYRDAHNDDSLPGLLSFAADMNTLKTSISAMAQQVVQQSLMICGMAGYKNGGEFSVGRQLRDLLSAPLMINNDRIAENTASLLLAQRSTTSMRF